MLVGIVVTVLVGIGVCEAVGSLVAVDSGVMIGVGVELGIVVGVLVGLGVRVGVLVGRGVRVGVLVGLGVRVGVFVGRGVSGCSMCRCWPTACVMDIKWKMFADILACYKPLGLKALTTIIEIGG